MPSMFSHEAPLIMLCPFCQHVVPVGSDCEKCGAKAVNPSIWIDKKKPLMMAKYSKMDAFTKNISAALNGISDDLKEMIEAPAIKIENHDDNAKIQDFM